jgi:hypothetical protein
MTAQRIIYIEYTSLFLFYSPTDNLNLILRCLEMILSTGGLISRYLMSEGEI